MPPPAVLRDRSNGIVVTIRGIAAGWWLLATAADDLLPAVWITGSPIMGQTAKEEGARTPAMLALGGGSPKGGGFHYDGQ